jgi:V/A-type H+-transporting ATPase subunit D
VFEAVTFADLDYDLFLMPLWVDVTVAALQRLVTLEQEINTLKQGIGLLRDELRITTQRVNLFEKVKIPEAEEAIRVIKIYIGDQMANAVGRSKAAKRKIEAFEELVLEGALA